MEQNSPVVQLCIAGTRAEYAGQCDVARSLYAQAWRLAENDWEACLAAHYAARFQEDAAQCLRWNQTALTHAALADPALVQALYPSLYLNMGSAYERLGDLSAAQQYYDLAASLGAVHSPRHIEDEAAHFAACSGSSEETPLP